MLTVLLQMDYNPPRKSPFGRAWLPVKHLDRIVVAEQSMNKQLK